MIAALAVVLIFGFCTEICAADRAAQLSKLAVGIGSVGAGYGAHVVPAVLFRNLWTRPNFEGVPRVYLVTH